ARIARGLRVPTGEVIRRYVQDGSGVLEVDGAGHCVFHRTEGCELDTERPMSCRNFADPLDGAGRFVQRARQYRAILRAWRATREGGSEADTPAADEGRRHAAPELGMWILDVDAMVAERCQEKGIPVPEDLEARIDIHLDMLRSALEG
nr:hypothetical protein [Candidatus Palauibacterales bacterium]